MWAFPTATMPDGHAGDGEAADGHAGNEAHGRWLLLTSVNNLKFQHRRFVRRK
jgi:hypothetical protein